MSNYLMSDNVVYANARANYTLVPNNGAFIDLPNATNTATPLSLVDESREGAFSIASNVLTVNVTGWYSVRFTSTLNNVTAPAPISLIYIVTGAGTYNGQYTRNFEIGASFPNETLARNMYLPKGATITFSINNVSGASTQVRVDQYRFSSVEINRLADYSAGQPVGFGVATDSQYGLVQAPRYIQNQFVNGISDGVYTNVGSATIAVEAGTYLLEYGARFRTTTSTDPSSIECVVGVAVSGDTTPNISLVESGGLLKYDTGDWRITLSNLQEITFASPDVIRLQGRTIVNGGATTSRDIAKGYIKATRIS